MNTNFLNHLANILNKVFDTDSFKIIQRQDLHILSKDLGIGVYSVVLDPFRDKEISLSELFSLIEEEIKKLKFKHNALKRLIIISTNSEENLIIDFIEHIRKKMNLTTEIEFWGWETLEKIFKNFPIKDKEELELEDTELLNFVPSANIYQLFGIEQILAKLDEKLDSSLTPIVIYNSLSGTGKTALLLAYAFHYEYQKKFDHKAYVLLTGDFKINFVNAFEGYLGFTYNQLLSIEQNLDYLLELLSQIPGRNLLLIDGLNNVEEAVELMYIVSRLKWKIIISSRFPLLGFENIYLPHPKKEYAIKIFSYYFKDLKETDLIEKLLDKVFYHPFAIVFFARFLTHFTLSLNDFLKILEDRDARIYHLGNYIDRRLSKNQIMLLRTLLKYIMAIFDYQVREMSVLEKEILLICSVLPQKNIEFSILKDIIKPQDEDKFFDTILLILSKGWLEADKDKFKVPELIQSVLHKKLKPNPGKLKNYIEFLFERLSDTTTKALQWLDFVQMLVRSVSKWNVDIANLTLLLAYHYDNLGMSDKAIASYEYAVYIIERIYNETGDERLLKTLAQVWSKIGRIQRAIFYAELVLQKLDLDKEEEQLMYWYQFLAKLYLNLDNYEKAIAYADNAVDMAAMLYDKDHPKRKEIEEFHLFISQDFKNLTLNDTKKQWLKRFFI